MLKSKKSLCLITGASQFLGSAIAQSLAEEVAPGSTLILSSRSLDRLENVRDEIKKKVGSDKVQIHLIQWDLRHPNADQYEKDLKKAIGDLKSIDTYDVTLVVHNAAQLGDLSRKVVDMKNVNELQEQLNINLVSMLVLNSVWLELVKNSKKKFVVNMSAGSASTARPSLGLTSMVKSSRYMTLSVLAKETPDVHVLHYDPEGVDTDSLRAIRDQSHSKEIRSWIAGFYEKGEVWEADFVVKALLKTLNDGKYESGAAIKASDVKL
jgi:sepiapterin reductase